MTEEQAKTKECPKRIMQLREYRSDLWEFKYSNCIASDCMIGCDKDGNWLGYCGLISTT